MFQTALLNQQGSRRRGISCSISPLCKLLDPSVEFLSNPWRASASSDGATASPLDQADPGPRWCSSSDAVSRTPRFLSTRAMRLASVNLLVYLGSACMKAHGMACALVTSTAARSWRHHASLLPPSHNPHDSRKRAANGSLISQNFGQGSPLFYVRFGYFP